jgi:hypothetical protein
VDHVPYINDKNGEFLSGIQTLKGAEPKINVRGKTKNHFLECKKIILNDLYYK